ncbi:MAG: 3-dehydroquinate synthase family protein [Planctomycetota bacterium]
MKTQAVSATGLMRYSNGHEEDTVLARALEYGAIGNDDLNRHNLGRLMYDRIFQFSQSRPSRVVIRRGLEAQLDEWLGHRAEDGLFLVFDPAVAEIADRLQAMLPIRAAMAFEGGEASKRLATVAALADQLLEAGATRHSMVLGLGGGVTTDVAAFLASVYMRGIACALLPTSLLAMVDAALGGKNGVDLGAHKNILGTIRQPDLVLCDPNWLESLPDQEFRTGLAEVVKVAAILDEDWFVWLEEHAELILSRDAVICEKMITVSAGLKMGVVIEDESEAWRRMLLNFGHTVGHAYEGLSEFLIPHGQAVAMGMVIECRAAHSEAGPRIESLLRRLGLPTAPPAEFSFAATDLWKLMQNDKKSRSGEVRIAVPTKMGGARIQALSEEAFLGALER